MKKSTILAILLIFAIVAVFAMPIYAGDEKANQTMEIVEPVDINILDQPVQMEIVNETSSEREPVQWDSGVVDFDSNMAHASYTVPSDKRLIIDSYSFMLNLPATHSIIMSSITTTANGTGAAHWFSVPTVGTDYAGTRTFYQGGGKVLLFADPSSEVTFFFMGNFSGSQGSLFQASFVGFLEPAP